MCAHVVARRVIRPSLMTIAWVATLSLVAMPVAANCTPDVRDEVLAPTEPPGHDQGPEPCPPLGCWEPPVVGGVDHEVPVTWQGESFRLWSGPILPCIGCDPTNPLALPADFAVRWYDDSGVLLDVHDTPGDEAGVVPAGAVSVKVTYFGPSLNEHFQLYVGCDKL